MVIETIFLLPRRSAGEPLTVARSALVRNTDGEAFVASGAGELAHVVVRDAVRAADRTVALDVVRTAADGQTRHAVRLAVV